MTFYVIGNGFDCHYALHTSYANFKCYLRRKGHSSLISKVDSVFSEIGGYSPEEVDQWSYFENMLTVFNRLDSYDIYQEAMDNAEQDDERADYFDDPAWNVAYYSKYIQVLKQEFCNWISCMNISIEPDGLFLPKQGDFILTFNYTHTIEENYCCDGIQITHIHGDGKDNIVLGHNEQPSPDLMPCVRDENSDYRDMKTREAVNHVLELASSLYFKNSESIIQTYQDLFDSISQYDQVVFMGLSCGKQDQLYIQKIVAHAKKIVFFFHTDKDKGQFLDCCGFIPKNVEYHKW